MRNGNIFSGRGQRRGRGNCQGQGRGQGQGHGNCQGMRRVRRSLGNA